VTRRTVTFSATANRDLVSIIGVIAENAGARVAARWRRAFEDRSNALGEQPFSARSMTTWDRAVGDWSLRPI